MMFNQDVLPNLSILLLFVIGLTNPLVALADSQVLITGSAAQILEPTDDANNRVVLDGELAVSRWEHAFFRFDLSSISADVAYAVFRVFHDGDITPMDLYLGGSEDNWSESTGTPAITQIFNDPALQIDRVTATGSGYVDFEVADFVNSQLALDGIATLELSSTTSLWSRVSSKEGSYPPQLILDFNHPPIPSLELTVDTDDYRTIHVDAQYTIDTDGTIVSYEWDFGDGAISSGIQSSYTYPVDGSYEVTLTVTDDQGASATASRPVFIKQPIDSYVIYPTDDANNRVLLDGELAVSRWEHAFLRFELGSITPTMLSAVLRIYHDGVNLPLTLYAGETDDNWSETTSTPTISMIQNFPQLQLAATDVVGAGYVELDLTDYIAAQSFADGIASIELSSNTGTWSRIDSREGLRPPELVITTGPDSDTGWSRPALLDTNTGNPYTPKISADSLGNYTAVWYQNDSVWSKRYSSENGWGTAKIISGNLIVNSYFWKELDIHHDIDGNVMVIWYDDVGIWYNRYLIDEGWTGVALADEFTDINSLDFAMDNAGRAKLVFESNASIYVMPYEPDTGWGAINLLENTEGLAFAPKVAVDEDGTAIAVWTQYDGNFFSVYANQFQPLTGWENSQIINDSADRSSSVSGVVFTGGGSAIAVWIESGSEVNDYGSVVQIIMSKRFSTTNGWETSEPLGKLRDDIFGSWSDVKIAGDEAGNLVIAWQEFEGRSWNSYLSVNYTSLKGWSDQEYIGSNSDGAIGGLDMNKSGQAAVTWIGVYGVEVNRFDTNTGWSGQTKITQDAFAGLGYTTSDIAVASSGDIMAVFGVENYFDAPISIYASEFSQNQ